MAKPFATVSELAARANEEIIEPEDIALAEMLLEIVSEEIRAIGHSWPEPVLAPGICRTLAIKVAARGYMNPAGYGLERGDMATLQRSSTYAAGDILTTAEAAMVRRAAGFGDITSVPIIRAVGW